MTRPRRRVVAGRRIGVLEAEVLERLWAAERPLNVHEISAGLAGRPRAYTTVMTILTRLVEKGLVERSRAGRSYVYTASGTPEEIAAGTIRDVLSASRDPRAVLARFVEQIADDRELLDELVRIVEQEAGR